MIWELSQKSFPPNFWTFLAHFFINLNNPPPISLWFQRKTVSCIGPKWDLPFISVPFIWREILSSSSKDTTKPMSWQHLSVALIASDTNLEPWGRHTADLGPFQHRQGWIGTGCLSTWLSFLLHVMSAESCLAGGEGLHYHKPPIRASPVGWSHLFTRVTDDGQVLPQICISTHSEDTIRGVAEKRFGEGILPNESSTWGLLTDITSSVERIRN